MKYFTIISLIRSARSVILFMLFCSDVAVVDHEVPLCVGGGCIMRENRQENKTKKCGFGRHPILLCYRRFCTDNFIGEFDVAATVTG